MNPLFRIDFSISDSLKIVRKSVLIYETIIIRALEIMGGYDLRGYTPAIILMTDGKSNGRMDFSDFSQAYEEAGLDVPVFSIMFGDAEEGQLEELAEYTHGRVFDGREDLVEAFRSVKGYN